MLFFGTAYAYVYWVGAQVSAQPPSAWILGANLVALGVSLALLLALGGVPQARRAGALIAGVLFLYQFGLLMQYSLGQHIPPKIDDLSGLRQSDQWVADSLFARTATGRYAAFAGATGASVRARAAKGDAAAIQFLNRWASRVNQALERRHADERIGFRLAMTLQKTSPAPSWQATEAATLLANRPANRFDQLPPARKLRALGGRLLPILTVWWLFACFGANVPVRFRATGLALALGLAGVAGFVMAQAAGSGSSFVLGTGGLVLLFGLAVWQGERWGGRIWHHLFEGSWWRWQGRTLYVSFLGACVVGFGCALLVWKAGVGAAESLKLPLAFIMMWTLYCLYVQSSLRHELPTRWQTRLRESPFFYPTRLLTLALALFAPLALTVLLDVGQAAVLSFALILMLFGVRTQIRGAQAVAWLLGGVVVMLYHYLRRPDAWAPVMAVLDRDVFWVLSLLVAGGVVIYWMTPYYRRHASSEAVAFENGVPVGRPYTGQTALTHSLFGVSLIVGGGFLAARVAASQVATSATVQHRLTLFSDLFSYRLVASGRHDSWWDAAHNLVESLFAQTGAGWIGASPGLGGGEHITKVAQDFMFSAIVADWGLLGAVAVLAVVAAVVATTLRIGAEACRVKPRFFAIAVASFFSAQTLVTVLGSMGALPITGVPFPMVSDGLTSATTYAVLLGLVAVIDQRQPVRPPPPRQHSRPRSSQLQPTRAAFARQSHAAFSRVGE